MYRHQIPNPIVSNGVALYVNRLAGVAPASQVLEARHSPVSLSMGLGRGGLIGDEIRRQWQMVVLLRAEWRELFKRGPNSRVETRTNNPIVICDMSIVS